MALGDKVIDYNFYGLAYRDISLRRSTNPDTFEANLLAKLVQKDTGYGYYINMETIPFVDQFNYGKELNDSIALWQIPEKASFNHATFCVKNSNTLNFVCDTIQTNKPSPLAMQFSDLSTQYAGFSTNPYNRLAYNYSSVGGYYNSALVADIAYTAFCTTPGINIYDRTTNSTGGAPSLSTVANWIDADINRDVTGLRITLFNGTEYPRLDMSSQSNATPIPDELDGRSPNSVGVPFVDALTYLPIPEIATTIRSRIQNGHDEWENSKIYAPFGFQYGRAWYDSETSAVDNLHRIGMYRNYTVNEVKNGQGSPASERGMFLRCNFDTKLFDDVSYKWELCCYYPAQGRFLQNGFDLTTITGSDNLRFFTRLVIVDSKGASRGTATYRAILHELAYLGFYFTKTGALARNTNFLTDSLTDVFLPIFDNGVTTGLYATGDDIKQLPNWAADSVNNSAFQYNPEGDAGGYDIGDFQSVLNSGAISAGTIYYAVSDTEFKDLVRYLNTTYNPDEDQLAADFKGVNPFDYITSVKYYPFPLPYAVSQAINVGPLATGVTGYIMPYTYGNPAYSYFDFGSYTFTPRYGNFLDYSATKITLYLPWCGSMQLDPALWIAAPGYPHITIKIKYSFDYVTGSVTAFIFRCTSQGDFLFTTADGQAGIDVPLSLYATGTYQQQIMQAQAAYKQAANTTAVTALGLVGTMAGTAIATAVGCYPAAIGGLVGIASGINKLNQSMIAEDAVSYSLDHTQPTLGNVSAASPFNAAIGDQRPFILISRPKLQQGLPIDWQAKYAHTVGYACTVPMQLSQARGFTVVQSPKLEGVKKVIGSQTFTPTKQEIQLIKQHLAAGVIF